MTTDIVILDVAAAMKVIVSAIMCLFKLTAFLTPPSLCDEMVSDYLVPPAHFFTPVPPDYYLTPPPPKDDSFEPTTIEEFPWHSFLNLYKKDGKWYGCNGSIISTVWIMTVAHCFTDENFEAKVLVDVKAVMIFAGLTYKDRRFKLDNPFIQTSIILHKEFDDHVKIHKDYKKHVKNNNDIALVKLKQHLQFNNWVQPIRLATTGDFAVGKSLTVTGWGETSHNRNPSNQLMKIEDLKIVSQSQCKAFWEQDGKSRITENMICHWTWGKFTCRGYSGGPAITGMGSNSGPPYVQIGIVSWGHKYCERSTPDVFVHVAKYRSWINNITAV